jgi:hypothetical protein
MFSPLNNDVLLNIFQLYRLAELDEHEDEYGLSEYRWGGQRWWYKLAHVCRLWRILILESPPRLFDLHLYCTNGVPVADMLAHSPLLPIVIHYHHHWVITAKDVSGILLALRHRDRVRRVDLWNLPNLRKVIAAMGGQFLILERLYIHSWTKFVLPSKFNAPNLRHLRLSTALVPIGSRLLTTTPAGLVTLELLNIPTFDYFPLRYILIRLSFMLQLEKLSIGFPIPNPDDDVERQLYVTPDMIIVTLPNLRWFVFHGASAYYLDGLVAWITAPSLSFLHVKFFNQFSFTVPRLLQFMKTSESLSFSSVELALQRYSVRVTADPWRKSSPLDLRIICDHLESQVASAVQIFGTLSPLLSAVEQVTFSYERHYESSEWDNNVHRGQWRELVRPFINAKTVCVEGAPVGEMLRPLLSHDGEPPLELLPNLEEVEHSGGGGDQDVLTAFVDERQVAGHPVNLSLAPKYL